MTAVAEIGDFTDKEIEAEYIERFGDPNDPELRDFSSRDLIEELEDRDAMPELEPSCLVELADLIAWVAIGSPHARKPTNSSAPNSTHFHRSMPVSASFKAE